MKKNNFGAKMTGGMFQLGKKSASYKKTGPVAKWAVKKGPYAKWASKK